jgi:hypothetical protein
LSPSRKNRLQIPEAHWVGVVQGWPSLPLHRLDEQVSFPTTHVLPQAPQLVLSLVRLTQLPLQPLWPAAQQMLLVQLLLAHWGLVWQVTPLPVGVTQVAPVPQTVPAAVQVPPLPPQQD